MVRFRIHLKPLPEKPRIIPSSVKILAYNITDKCNLECPHCFAEDNRKELNTEECKDVLEQAKELNCVRVILCGKEPLMRDDIFDILNYITELGMDTELMTNGTLIDDSTITALGSAGVKKIQVSIDGFEKTHDSLRGMPGAYKLAHESIQKLISNGFETSVNTVVLEENWQEIPELIKFYFNSFPSMTEWRLSRLIPSRSTNLNYSNFDIYKKAIKAVCGYLQTLDRPYHVEIEDNPIVFEEILPDEIKDLAVYTPCGVITHTIDVLNNGDVVFCVPIGSHQSPAIHGNALKDGLKKIVTEVRKYNDNNVDDQICHECEHYRIRCFGGCRCVAYAYRGNEYLADPFCPKIKESLEQK